MEILKFPNPTLLKRCAEVTVFGPELKKLLDLMVETMLSHRGVGLAANQVGLSLRMFVMVRESGERLNVINPKILSASKAMATLREGCLSAPGEFVVTGSRAQWVQMEFVDESGVSQTMTLGGLDAVCAQHELEHLDGKAFVQSKSIPKNKRREICERWGLKSK